MTPKEFADNLIKEFESKKTKAEMRHDVFEFYRDDIVIGYVQALNEVISSIKYTWIVALNNQNNSGGSSEPKHKFEGE